MGQPILFQATKSTIGDDNEYQTTKLQSPVCILFKELHFWFEDASYGGPDKCE